MGRTLMLVAVLAWSAGADAQDTGETRTWEEQARESHAGLLGYHGRLPGASPPGSIGGRAP